MPTQITPKTDNILVLRLNPLTELKACGASLTGGTIASSLPEFATAAAHITMSAGTGFVLALTAFAATSYAIYEAMEHRALTRGQWKITALKRPKIDI